MLNISSGHCILATIAIFFLLQIQLARTIKCFQCSFKEKEPCSRRNPHKKYLKECSEDISKDNSSMGRSVRTICGIWTFRDTSKSRPGFTRQCMGVKIKLPPKKTFLENTFFEETIMAKTGPDGQTYTNNYFFVCGEEGCNDHEVVFDYESANIKYKSHNPQAQGKS